MSTLKQLTLTMSLEISESFRARWFYVYSLIFGGLVLALLLSGIANSRVMGFTGMSRVLLIYLQLCMAILPIFIMLTSVRSVAGDREAGIYEYLLSFPVSLRSWFWGKVLGRFLVVFVPVIAAMCLASLWAVFFSYDVPLLQFIWNVALITSLVWCFVGISSLISALVRSTDIAQGIAFVLWLVLLLFIDIILLGALVSNRFSPESIILLALLNPLQVFRTASMLLFDPNLMLMGPAAYVVFDFFGKQGYFVYALLYPILIGTFSATAGFFFFRRSDLP